MKTTLQPTSIDLNKAEGFLRITWSDGAVCQYPLSNLREACPCVECRGGHDKMGMAHAPDNILTLLPARSYDVENLEVVGSYALQFFWNDGHHTGIYTWEYLRKLCPKDQADD